MSSSEMGFAWENVTSAFVPCCCCFVVLFFFPVFFPILFSFPTVSLPEGMRQALIIAVRRAPLTDTTRSSSENRRYRSEPLLFDSCLPVQLLVFVFLSLCVYVLFFFSFSSQVLRRR